MKKKIDFKIGDYCVYNTHGVGQITNIQTLEFGKTKFRCYTLFFEKDKLTINVPADQMNEDLVRSISDEETVEKAFTILSSGVKKMKGMWSRRAKEYEEKINSGSILSIAEVIRDLTRDTEEADRSFSERTIYDNAVDRISLEYSVLKQISFDEAREKIIEISKQKIRFAEISKCKEVKEA